MTSPLRYEFPPEKVRHGIHWLEIVEGDGGYYLYQYADIGAPPRWDAFFGSIEEVFSACEKQWGLSMSDWHEVK